MKRPATRIGDSPLTLGPARRPAAPRTLSAATATLAAFAAACSLAPPPRVAEPAADLPDSYDLPGGGAPEAPGDEAAPRPAQWWEGFQDPALNRLVETALVGNLDLQEAIWRLEELRYRYRIARSHLMPTVNLGIDGNRSDAPSNTGLGGAIGGDNDLGGFQFPDRFEFTTYSASLGFSYELDFWGRLRNDSRASVRDFLASRGDAETVRVTVIAATISGYLEVAALRGQLALARESDELMRERVELTEARYRAGLVGSFELYGTRQTSLTTESELFDLRTALTDAEGRLAVLLGQHAGTLGELLPDELRPSADLARIPAGLPVALLEQRPDVAAAYERMEAARFRVGARRAEMLPRLTLSGAGGFQSGEPSSLLRPDQWFMNLLGGLTAPIFQGGRLRANLGVAGAQYEQAVTAWSRTVLNAYREAHVSLSRLDNERERYMRVARGSQEALASMEEQLERYTSGVTPYVAYVDARLNYNRSETARLQALRSLGEARLQVHRALGGAWTENETAPNRNGAEGQ
ncbi:MAG: TolC family protein [Gemmatimonadetes bacterium]|nr:TolC family protein [Gemmatimonadota bacterium]